MLIVGGASSPSILRTSNNGTSWHAFVNNFGGEIGFSAVRSFASVGQFSDTLFATGSAGGIIVRSMNGGKSWELLIGSWDNIGGAGIFVKTNSFDPGKVWAGGVGPFSKPYLIFSDDYGKSWKSFESVSKAGEAFSEGVIYDLVTHPLNSDLILVGLEGRLNGIKKSTDGGKTWQMVLKESSVRSFARSKRNPDMIYASGRSSSGKLFFATTSDFGRTWEKHIFKDGPASITTNDLGVMTIEGEEVLILGTSQGLYNYRF